MMSTSDNYTGPPPLDWKPYDTAAAVISFLLCILIVCCNGIVLKVLLQKQHRKGRLHFFIMNLAIADMLVGVINVFGDGLQSSMEGAWYGGDVFCRIWRYLKVVLIMASNSLLIGLSVDRFLAVAFPMMFMKKGTKLNKGLVFGSWITSVTTGVFFLIYAKGVNGTVQNGGRCDLEFPAAWWKPYFITLLAMVYVIPLSVITVCYIGICIVIWQKWRDSVQLSASHDKEHRNAGLLPKAKVKSIKITLAICLTFFLCWTPYFCFALLDLFGVKSIEQRLYMVLQMLYPLNSACNPIIFILFNLEMFVQRTSRSHSLTTEEGGTQLTTA